MRNPQPYIDRTQETKPSRSSTKSSRTRAAILAAAGQCFRECGYDATTAEVARRAGVAEGTVFLHFGNKLGLLNAVTVAFYDFLQVEAELALALRGDAVTRLRRLVEGWAARMETDWDLIAVFAQRSQIQPDSELTQTIVALNRRYTRLFLSAINELKAEGALPTSQPSTFIRDVIFGTLEHAVRGQVLSGQPIKAQRVGQRVIDLLLATAGAPATDDQLNRVEAKLDRVLESVS